MECTILGNFDDGSIDCLNFVIVNHDDVLYIDVSVIRELKLVTKVNEARKLNKSHISINLEYKGIRYLEIQWG